RPELPDGVCPWAYPVLLRNRGCFEHQLRDRSVPLFTFGEVLHPLLEGTDPATRTDAEDLSRQLMLLPVHQNLSAEDVSQYAEEINRFLGSIEQTLANSDTASGASEPVDLLGIQLNAFSRRPQYSSFHSTRIVLRLRIHGIRSSL